MDFNIGSSNLPNSCLDENLKEVCTTSSLLFLLPKLYIVSLPRVWLSVLQSHCNSGASVL